MTATFQLLPNPALSTSMVPVSSLDGFFSDWRHGIKDIAGNAQADGTIPLFDPNTDIGMTSAQMRDFFMTAVGKRIKVSAGGKTHWSGQIVRLELTHRGQQFVRTMENLKTRIKIIYSKVGPQLLIDGDVEIGVWTQVGTPSTFALSTSWFAKGTQSMHIVSDAAGEGATIENGASPANVTIAASTAYTASCIVNVVSGVWTLRVVNAGTSEVLASRVSTDTGREWMQCQIPDTNTATSVRLQLVCEDSAQEIYADGAILRKSAVRSETKWYEDTNALADYGRIEEVLLEGEMIDDEADAMAAKELAKKSWLRTLPPVKGSSVKRGRSVDQLIVSCLGMSWSLTWRNALTDGTDQASDHIGNLLDESQFYVSTDGMIDGNSTEVLIESTNPVTLWRNIKKVLESGDGLGNEWLGGGYPDFVFKYEARPTGLQYKILDGVLTHINGALVDPLEFRPGWCLMADMPLYQKPGGSTAIDDPRRFWINETWFVWKNGQAGLEWSREKYGNN